MKYGLLKTSSPKDDEKGEGEQTEVTTQPLEEPEKIDEKASEPSSRLIVPAIDTNESTNLPTDIVVDIIETTTINNNDDSSTSHINSQLQNEPVDIHQIIVPNAVSETPKIGDVQIPLPEVTCVETIDTIPDHKIIQPFEELTIAKPLDHCETMVCDVDGQIHASQEATMEVSNDDEASEIEMFSEPPTPKDIDMSDTGGTVDRQTGVKYNFKNAPIIELSRFSWGANEQKYLRGCLFSPDGTCILTNVNKDEGGTVYDYCWYPYMNSTMPETCCFLSTRQHEPIQLWDAFDRKLRCTYRGYDAADEVDNALSVCFSIDGSQVIAGYKKTLKIFRTDVPGRDYTNFPPKSPAACLAINGADENMIAIGSWNSFITFHDVRSPKLTITKKLVKHTGGVTLMKFSSDGKRLITGARKDNKLLGWDVRNVSKYFDMSWSGEWLVSGDTSGIVHAFDLM